MTSYSYPTSLRTWSSASLSTTPQWDSSGESTTPESTTSSSVASSYFDPFNDHRYDNQRTTALPSETFVEGLMRIQKEKTHETGEWKWKCNQLEQTVSRLMRQVEVLKKERDDLRLESIATGTANLVFGVDDENSVRLTFPSYSLDALLTRSSCRLLTLPRPPVAGMVGLGFPSYPSLRTNLKSILPSR